MPGQGHEPTTRARPRWQRVAPLIAAIALSAITVSARQWEGLTRWLPKQPDSGIYLFSPSGNEWRLRRWHAFAADAYELRRTFTLDASADPLADVTATFPARDIPREVLRGLQLHPSRPEWAAETWGWPMRHARRDHLRRVTFLPLGFAVNTLVITPIWLLLLHLVRAPVSFVLARLRRPEHLCPRCRYDLRGLADDAPCPECGRPRISIT